MKPVRGDLVTTANFAVVVRLVPTSGALANINGFAGDSGSTLAGACSKRSVGPRRMPPRYLRSRDSSKSSYALRPLVRSTRSTRPKKPCTGLASRVRRENDEAVSRIDHGRRGPDENQSV